MSALVLTGSAPLTVRRSGRRIEPLRRCGLTRKKQCVSNETIAAMKESQKQERGMGTKMKGDGERSGRRAESTRRRNEMRRWLRGKLWGVLIAVFPIL